MFEHKAEPLISKSKFYSRLFRYFLYSTLLLSISLGIGILGYHHYGRMGWVDAFYNACMILTGMGPAQDMPGNSAKIFSGCYALFSGIAFLSTVATFFAPIVHRFLHLMHIDDED